MLYLSVLNVCADAAAGNASKATASAVFVRAEMRLIPPSVWGRLWKGNCPRYGGEPDAQMTGAGPYRIVTQLSTALVRQRERDQVVSVPELLAAASGDHDVLLAPAAHLIRHRRRASTRGKGRLPE